MTHSLGLQATILCDNCESTFGANLWVIVDVAERPDLLDCIRAGTLHTFTCSTCRKSQRMSASLLVYQPEGNPALIFSPVKAGTPDTQRQEATQLASTLSQRLGDAWCAQWLSDGLHVMSREELASFLIPGQIATLNNRGLEQNERFRRNRTRGCLDKAITLFGEALGLIPETWLVRDDLLGNLGLALRDRFHESSDGADLQRAIEYHTKVLDRTSRKHPKRPSRLTYLGLALRDRYKWSGSATDLRDAVSLLKEAAHLLPSGAPDRGDYLQRVAGVLELRYDCEGDVNDLKLAIATWTDLLLNSPTGTPKRCEALGGLASCLRSRYRHAGNPDDLQRAIGCRREALECVEAASSAYTECSAALGVVLSDSYERTGSLEDIEEAIQLFRRALDAVSQKSSDRPVYLANLGAALHKRYILNALPGDLDEAVTVLTEAAHLTPVDARARTSRVNKLGVALMSRFSALRMPYDLKRAIEHLREGLRLAPPGSIDRHELLSNLGGALSTRYKHQMRQDDLDEALDLWQEALSSSGSASFQRVSCLNNRGIGLRDRFMATSNPLDFSQARKSFREACELGLTTNPDAALASCATWGNWALERQAWSEACQAFAYGLQIIDRLLEAQLLRGSRLPWLGRAQWLHRHAAFAFARNGDPVQAVTVLEAGRARLMSDFLERDRVDLEQLPARGHAAAYERYRAAVEAVALLERVEASAELPAKFAEAAINQEALDGPRFSATEQNAIPRREANARLSEAIAAIRRIEGYEDFFSAPSFETLQRPFADAPGKRAAVYLVVTSFGGMALVVHGGGVEPVWFELSAAQLQDLLVTGENGIITAGYVLGLFEPATLPQTLEALLYGLGEKVVEHVVAPMQRLFPRTNTSLGIPELVLVPTGLLSLCPLHAARIRVDNKDCALLDGFVISYSPSLRAFGRSLDGQRRLEGTQPSLLGVGNPLPLPAHKTDLQFARTEIEEIVPLFDGRAEPLLEADATRDKVADRLAAFSYLHFACHGVFDPITVLDSSLVLADGDPLRVRHLITGLALRGSRLVVLSACQTAISDFQKLPEEAVGMSSAFLQAGVPGVVGTLWPIRDGISTVLLMVQFYRYHLHGDPSTGCGPMQPPAALRQAQIWLRGVTAAELGGLSLETRAAPPEPSRLAAEELRHLALRPPNDRPFENPYYWAPFVYYGA